VLLGPARVALPVLEGSATVPSAVLTAIPITVTPSAAFAPSSVLFDLVCAKAGEATSAQTSVINIFFISGFLFKV